MATIIFDFDDTLFGTHKLSNSIFKKMESIGIPLEVIKNTYELTKQKFSHYTIDNHINIINEIKEFNITDSEKDKINKIDFSLYKSKETYNFLNDLAKKHTLILLTKIIKI